MARKFGDGVGAADADCSPSPSAPHYPDGLSCAEFYDWNARVQLTTWAGGYAGKHWNGLISGFFAKRVSKLMDAALAAAGHDKPMSQAMISAVENEVSDSFVTDFNATYTDKAVGDAVKVATEMVAKYGALFATCA